MARTSRDPKDVTPKELEILQVLWEDGPATIRALTEKLYPDGGAGAYGSIQKLLERLEEKGMVERRRTEPAHTFAATVARDQLIGRRLQEVAETLCGGSLTPLLTHLVKQSRLSDRERRELRNLIDDLDQAK
jgi:predicted transcriptional regulator